MPSTKKYKTLTKPAFVYVLVDGKDILGVFERKIDAQNDAINHMLTNYTISEVIFK
jgi:hypothetical protein